MPPQVRLQVIIDPETLAEIDNHVARLQRLFGSSSAASRSSLARDWLLAGAPLIEARLREAEDSAPKFRLDPPKLNQRRAPGPPRITGRKSKKGPPRR